MGYGGAFGVCSTEERWLGKFPYLFVRAEVLSDALGSREAFGMVYRPASEGLVYWSC